ncbi:MAG: LamG domain-containing protein, partial [Candidatus Paceibacterota bacterium]
GEWTFDGGNAIDTSGFNNHGTVSGATFATTSGYNNKGAYLFNVETNIITIPSSETLKLTDKMTISAWVNIASTGSMKGVIVSKHFQNFDYTFKYDNSQLMIRLVSGSTSYYTIKRGALDLNTWYNVVATWDKTLNSGKGRIFVNGSEVSYSQQDALVDNVNTSAQPLYIGNDRASCPCVEFSGLIDDVRVYSSSLSSSDIQKLYAEGISSHSSLANK